MLTIIKYIVDPTTGQVHTYYNLPATTAMGERTIEGYALLSEDEAPLDKPGWTNDDLAAALSAKLEIAPTAARVSAKL